MSSSNAETPGSQLAAGAILQNRYCVVRPLGKGGMGAVYEALDGRLDVTVAIKETFSSDDHLRKQFEREARMLANLHHPSLPRVSDYFTEGDRTFLVMQFIDGVDLARIIAQQPGPFPLESVVAWADQLLDALVYLHSRDRQVIHRDIKPHNLKLTPQGQIALLDFGLAKAQQRKDGGVTSSAAIHGYTKQYAPLEQIQDLATGPRSDIYALGATLYHLLTGVKPPDALTRAAALVQSRPDPLRPANEVHWAIGSEIAAILDRAMAQNADDRYASASEFRNALRCVGRTRIAVPVAAVPVTISQVTRATDKQPEDEHSTQPRADAAANAPELFASPKKSYLVHTVAAAVFLLFAAIAALLIASNSGVAETPADSAHVNPDSTQLSSAAMRANKHSQKPEAGSSNRIPATEGAAPVDVSKMRATPQSQLSGKSNLSEDSHADLTRSPSTRNAQQPKPSPIRSVEAFRALKAPNIRFPMADQQRDFAAIAPPSSAVVEPRASYGSPAEPVRSAAAPEVREPQILRARDGTQIVKFPDGSTRVFRPGEKNLRAEDTPQ